MDTPQEIQVWYVLPALRKKYALFLKNKGYKQKQIAEIMNITEAAVSQYLKNKRANIDLMSKNIDKEIKKSIENILSKKSNFKIELQRNLKKISNEKIICKICQKHTNSDPNCNICYE
ncbi:MAG: helix-turn-helix domain-containing protein [Candidatus Woesearchaeota archaeon]